MRKLTQEEVIKKFKQIHGNKFDYSKVIYTNAKTKVCIICPLHREFWQTPDNHLQGKMCPLCSHMSFPYTTEEFIKKAISIHGNKYDYSKTIYVNAYTKICIICPIHGEFWQTPSSHLKEIGCYYCGLKLISYNLSSSKEEFITKSNLIHFNFYDYSKVNYINSWTKVCIICPDHGEFWVTPNNHLNQKSGCPKCSYSKGETTLETIFKKHNIKIEPQWKHPDEKYLFEYDFYLPEYKILIEFHGKQHYEWIPYFQKTYHDFEEQCKRDSWKITLAKEKGIPLIEFNYKQLDNLSLEQFEELVLKSIKNRG